MIHWWNNLLNTPLTKMLPGGKYEVLRRDIEELVVENWLSRLYIFNQGGSVLFYNGGSLLLYNPDSANNLFEFSAQFLINKGIG